MRRSRYEPKPAARLWSPTLAQQMTDFEALDRACRHLTDAAMHIQQGAQLLRQARLDAGDIVDDEARRLFTRAAGQLKASLDVEFFGQDEQQ